jgi:cytochrome c-type biogenesis protein CcmF
MGVTIWGIAAITAWQVEDIRIAKVGDLIPIGGYEVRFDSVEPYRGPNFVANRGHFTVIRNGVEGSQVHPEKRLYVEATPPMPTTEAGIDYGFTRDVYVVLGDPQTAAGEAWAVRSYVKPFANWIWGGAVIMALGGALSLTDRRYRVGAPVRARGAAGLAVPAE